MLWFIIDDRSNSSQSFTRNIRLVSSAKWYLIELDNIQFCSLSCKKNTKRSSVYPWWTLKIIVLMLDEIFCKKTCFFELLAIKY